MSSRDEATGAVSAPVAEALAVTKRFGPTTALDTATLRVFSGESHGLVGRNGAGKSTLVSLLTGLQKADAGEIRFAGRPAPPFSDRRAWREVVACVFQSSTVIPSLTVAENLFLHRQADPRQRIRWASLRGRAQALLEEWDVAIDVRRLAGDLDVEQRQIVEIARALSLGSRFVILDEPTAQLDRAGAVRLFARVRQLQARGVTFLFISHHLAEVYEICTTVSVFRDARHVLTSPVNALSEAEMVVAMTGGSTADSPRAMRRSAGTEPVVLSIEGLTVDIPSSDPVEDVDLAVRAGEVVGLAGIGGSGKAILAETVAGLHTPTRGHISVGGRTPRAGSVTDALRCGVGFVPRDRRKQGLVPLLSVAENSTLTVQAQLGRAGFVSPRSRSRFARRQIADLDIKVSSPAEAVANLSGGNQQKVVLARALASDPALLVLIDPTAGVDVRSKESLLGQVAAAASRGTAVLLVSDELADLRVCDRVIVMFRGRRVTERAAGWTDVDLVADMEGVADHAG